jgi:hypothetical protein
MSGFWAVFWLAVVLKLPIAALLYLVWWAIQEPPQPEPGDADGGSGQDDPHPRIRPPQPPRRGPHTLPVPASPPRVRVASRPPVRHR